MPLDFLLRLMRDPRAPIAKRLEVAKAAAPFLHPRLNPIDQQATVHNPTETTQIRVSFMPPRAPKPDE
jgi:hypothetical protein